MKSSGIVFSVTAKIASQKKAGLFDSTTSQVQMAYRDGATNRETFSAKAGRSHLLNGDIRLKKYLNLFLVYT